MATMNGSPSARRSHRLRRLSTSALLAALLVSGAACASDADPPGTTETTASTVAGEGGASTTAGSGSTTGDGSGTTTITGPTNDVGTGPASPEVTAYCDDVEEVAQLMADMRANPTNDAVNEVNDRLAQLTETATQLMADHPDEVDHINDCAEALTAG